MDRSNSYRNDHDSQSIRSFRSSTSGSVSEAGRTEAMSLARPRTDQEIEDRFVDFMVSGYNTSQIFFFAVTLGTTREPKWLPCCIGIDMSKHLNSIAYIAFRTTWECMCLSREKQWSDWRSITSGSWFISMSPRNRQRYVCFSCQPDPSQSHLIPLSDLFCAYTTEELKFFWPH
jgi:hypothetical protein